MAQDMLIGNESAPVPADIDSATTTAPSNDAVSLLQQFCQSAKNAQGAAILELVRQVLEAPNIYVFGELLEMPNIQELQNGNDVKYYNTLNLFAYGTFKQYQQNASNYIELTPAMLKKLQHLTLVSFAIKQKSIPYDLLLEELEINNVRHLEDIIIEAIYADIIHAKLFQNTRILEIDYAQGRDIPPGYLSKIAKTLKAWVYSCDSLGTNIEDQIAFANLEKAKRLKSKERIEAELVNLKKVIKHQTSDSDESMQIDSRDTLLGPGTSQELRKKNSKVKTPRTCGGKSTTTTPTARAVALLADLKSSSGNTSSTSWHKSLPKSFDKE